MVSKLSIAIIIVNMILGVLIPIVLLVYFKKKYQAGIKSFFIGCAVMFLFALVLEQLVHVVVLGSPVGIGIQENIWMYAIYGSMMAGLFEETGRLLAMRYVLKKEHDNAHNALMYGAGHGGFEMFVILSIGMINNLIYSVMINLGKTQALFEPLNEAARGTLQAAFDSLIQTPYWYFMLCSVERFAAITAQIGLSVIVWYAATGKKIKGHLFVLAILLHAILDGVAVITAKSGMSLIIVEVLICLMAIGIALIARGVWKKEKTIAEQI
ncbi:MAG: YhfC family glutamic-type intramembrane protease [Clostridiales bacterium]|nr:YhfC family glutamic-type intramembrane protease [Clostridiales bacterium]